MIVASSKETVGLLAFLHIVTTNRVCPVFKRYSHLLLIDRIADCQMKRNFAWREIRGGRPK